MRGTKLNPTYYQQKDVVKLAQDLIGKCLVTQIEGCLTWGLITETEAYEGVTDKASHAYNGRRTKRTETMYAKGGISYVYLCYGIHALFNVVSNVQDTPHAVLIRSILPLGGLESIYKRQGKSKHPLKIGVGPGNVSKCLGIGLQHNASDLYGETIWIEGLSSFCVPVELMQTGQRIGIDYAEEDALLPYRFWVNHQALNAVLKLF